MFGADRKDCVALATVLFGVLASGASMAQSAFGGSFDSAPAATPPAAQQPGPSSGHGGLGSGFGGSFDSAAPVQPPVQSPSSPPTVQPVVPPTSDSEFGGNFDGTPPPADLSIDRQILAFETRGFGIPPQRQLKSNPMHGPTPTRIPGAGLVSTKKLAEVIAAGQPFVLIDVLGGDYSLPDAFIATDLAASGRFDDRIQQKAARWLHQISGGDGETPIVIYCSDPQCWLSYNAVLRAVAAGYTHVYWYRGGIQAWQMAGLPIVPSGL